tara:strand:+ start:30 stop:557 length:528 start_codon:yes stop_codon:yes gene_type:complete
MLNECYVLVSVLPQDTVNLISCFIGNPFTESRKLRTESIVNFIKLMIISDLEKRGYRNLDKHISYNETIVNTLFNSTNNEMDEESLVDSLLLNKLVSIDNLRLDTFLKRYKRFDDMNPYDNEGAELMIRKFKPLLYHPRVRDYAKPDYFYDIEDLGITPYWESRFPTIEIDYNFE